jgi:hypothetical protein
MTLPFSIRVNVGVPFPARVQGSGFLTVVKANGIFTLGIDYSLLGTPIPLNDPANTVVAVFNLITKAYNLTTLQTLIASAIGGYRIVTAAGDVAVLASDTTILLNKTVGAATNILLPTSASRQGVPLRVKDYKQDANTNNITFVMSGTETLDGKLQAAADTAGLTKIDINGDDRVIYPLTSGGWYT